MKVIAYGRITAFPRDGQYQLYVDALTPDGVGELYVAFEQLKNKLYQEGFFAASIKSPSHATQRASPSSPPKPVPPSTT